MKDTTDCTAIDAIHGVLLKLSAAVRSAASMQVLYSSIHACVGELMDVRNFYIALYKQDESGRELMEFPYYVDQIDTPPESPEPYGENMTSYVIRTGRSLLLTREQTAELVARGEISRIIGTTSEIWLGVPLKVEGRIIGAVVVQSYDDTIHYGEREKDLLTFVSDQIALAIELRQYRDQLEEMVRQRTDELLQEKRVQAVLYEISEAVYSAKNLKGFLQTVHHRIGELMAARNFYVAMYDRESDSYSFPYFSDDYDKAEDHAPEVLRHSLTDYVRLNGPHLVDHREHVRLIETGRVKGVIGTDSAVWLGVPLLVPGKSDAIGVMVVQSYENPRAYGEKEKKVMINIAATVALAIDRLQLATSAVHHFNNSITGIKGNAELLMLDNARMQKQLSVCRAELDEMRRPHTAPAVWNEALQRLQSHLAEMQEEAQRQAQRLAKIKDGSDKASTRVNTVFVPIIHNI